MEQGDFSALKKMGGRNVQIEAFTPDFISYLAAADLSVSMGGYNTTMNLLATGVPALVWPFPQNREQRLRAGRLAQKGILRLIEDQDLRPDRLAAMMGQMLATANRVASDFDLDGAAHTARWIGQANAT